MAAVTLDRARKHLLWLWFSFLALNLSQVFCFWLLGWIETATLLTALEQLSLCYGPYLGAMLAFFYTLADKPGGRRHPGTAFRLALAGSWLWNLMIAVPLATLFFAGSIDQVLGLVAKLGALFAWLVAGAVGYYFSAQARG